MKIINILIISLITFSCSFDNKTGIWEDGSVKVSEKIENNKTVVFNVQKKIFAKEVDNVSGELIQINTSKIIKNWLNNYFNLANDLPHINFNLEDKTLFGVKNNSKYPIMKKIISNGKELIYNNTKGEIFIYNSETSTIQKFNFYKNKLKKIDKKLYIGLNQNILYVADSLGYLYNYDIINKKLIWAKNYGIPFRSALKFADNQIILSNQDNEVFGYDSMSGDIIWKFALKKSFLKSKYENSLIVNKKYKTVTIYTTDGEIYSINYDEFKINWVLNLNTDSFINDIKVFINHPLVFQEEGFYVGTNKSFSKFNFFSTERIWEKNISIKGLPIISGNNIFLISQQNYLICLNKQDGKIIWSKNIKTQAKKYNKKMKISDQNTLVNFFLIDNKISLFFSKGLIINIDHKNGEINSFINLKKKITSSIIFTENKMVFFSNKKIFQYK